MLGMSAGLLMSKAHLLKGVQGVFATRKNVSQWKRALNTLPSTALTIPKRVVVFDIDETLCVRSHGSGFKSKPDQMVSHDCTTHEIMTSGSSYEYCSFPHLNCLVNYLMSKSIRIAVFSIGEERRNMPLMKKVFTHVFGETEYNKLVSEGQFQVFSKHHRLDKYSSNKDLLIVLKQDDEQLEHCLLIDDYNYCCKPNQEKIFILVPSIIGFQNLAFYYIGLFKSYFDSDSCTTLSISHFMSEKIQMSKTGDDSGWQKTDVSIQFVLDMVKIGLDEVRKTEPNAAFYKFDYFMDEVFASNPDNDRFTPFENNKIINERTKMPIMCDEPYYLMKRDDATKALMRFHDTHLALHPTTESCEVDEKTNKE